MTNRMVLTQDVKMWLTNLSNLRCVSVLLIIVFLYKRFFPFDQNVVRPLCLMMFILITRGNAQIIILNDGFLTDHSHLLHHWHPSVLCILALWHLFRFIGSDCNCKDFW